MADDKWNTLPFDQAVQVNPSVPLQRGEAYPFVDMQAIDPSSRSVGPSEIRAFNGGGSRFIAGDTLMARITPCLENGKIARFAPNGDQQMGHGSTEFIVIRGKPGVTDNDFAYYLTKWDGVRLYCISQMTGTSGRQRVPTHSLSHCEVTIPPLREQQAIACILGTLDDKIELNRKRCKTLEAMARAIFQSWFVDFDPVKAKAAGRTPPGLSPELAALFPDRFEDSPLGPIPAGWRVGSVRELCFKVENGGTPKRQVEEYWTPAEVPWLTSGEVRQSFVVETENFISKSGFYNSSAKMWPPFTTVVALYGATAGIATLIGIELCANQACCGLIPKKQAACYIHQMISSSLLSLQQQARGSAQQNLSQSIVADLTCLIPKPELLEAFEQLVHPMYQRCIQSIEESRTLAALRDTLLPKLISGELRVPDAERIVGRAT